MMSFRACGALGVALFAISACAEKPGATSASSTDAGPIGAPVAISSPAPDSSNTPGLVVDKNGALLLSWTERHADSSVAIRMATWRNAQWDTARTVGEGRPFFVNWADFPSMTVLRDGSLAAHWLEREGKGKYAYGVRVVRSSDQGRTWSAPVTPHTDALEAEHGFVTLWPEGDNALGLAWLDGRKSAMKDSAREMTVRTAVVGADGALSREALLDARSCDCCQVASAQTASGHVVVYRDRTSAEIRDIVAVRRVGDTWSEPVVVHADDWHYPGCPVNGPSVVARGDTVTVAWFTGARDTARVYVATSVDGGAHFAAPTRVDDGDPIGRAVVVYDRAGDAIVGWMERITAETAEVRVRRVSAGVRSAAQTVSTTSSARQSGFPRMVVMGDTLVAAWTAVSPSLKVQLVQLPLNSRTTR